MEEFELDVPVPVLYHQWDILLNPFLPILSTEGGNVLPLGVKQFSPFTSLSTKDPKVYRGKNPVCIAGKKGNAPP